MIEISMRHSTLRKMSRARRERNENEKWRERRGERLRLRLKGLPGADDACELTQPHRRRPRAACDYIKGKDRQGEGWSWCSERGHGAHAPGARRAPDGFFDVFAHVRLLRDAPGSAGSGRRRDSVAVFGA